MRTAIVRAVALAAAWQVVAAARTSRDHGFRVANATELARLAPFVMISSQRTGSQWIMKTLKKDVCDVDASSEIFTTDARWNTTFQMEALRLLFDVELPARSSLFDRVAVPHQFADDLAKSRAYDHSTAYGFKWMLNQGMADLWDWFLDLAEARGLKLVFLKRRDLLRMYISTKEMKMGHAARHDGVDGDIKMKAHPTTEAELDAVRSEQLILPTGRELIGKLDVIANKFNRMGAYMAAAARRGIPTMEILYEDMSSNHSRFLDVQRFLTRDLRGETCDGDARSAHLFDLDESIKIHAETPDHYVANWAEVEATLRRSPTYRALLDDYG